MPESGKLPKAWTQRIRDEETLEKFEDLQEKLEDRSRQYSNQNTGLFAIELAHQKLQELRELDKDIQEAI